MRDVSVSGRVFTVSSASVEFLVNNRDSISSGENHRLNRFNGNVHCFVSNDAFSSHTDAQIAELIENHYYEMI